MFVLPAPDRDRPGHTLTVRYPSPSYAKLSELGAEVPETQFWLRRVMHGDVVLRKDAPESAE